MIATEAKLQRLGGQVSLTGVELYDLLDSYRESE